MLQPLGLYVFLTVVFKRSSIVNKPREGFLNWLNQNMSFIQYLKDTRAELRHVAWPTRTQTVIFTVLVVALSVFVSLYLGFFDYLFTGILERFVSAGGFGAPVTLEPAVTATSSVISTTTLQ